MAESTLLISTSRPLVKELIDSTAAAIRSGKEPKKTDTGAAYYIRDASNNPVAVFKPLDEEFNYDENRIKEEALRRDTPEGSRMGTKAGKGGYREAAAYILDQPIDGESFAGVPPTTFVSFRLEYFKNDKGDVTAKFGSLQKYIDTPLHCNMIVSDVHDKFPKDQVHNIAVLDIRLENADRHGGNILRSKSNSVLTPIDHGYCFPFKFGGGRFCWLNWEVAKEPFSSDTMKYIEKLNAEEDIRLLDYYGLGMSLQVARVFHTSTMLLKKGAGKGLTPYTIGNIMCRSIEDKDKECKIEGIFNEASKEFPLKEDNPKFIEAVSAKIDSHLDEIAK